MVLIKGVKKTELIISWNRHLLNYFLKNHVNTRKHVHRAVLYKQIKQRARTHFMYCTVSTSTQLAQINYEIKINPELGIDQGWEFAHRFFEQFAHFLRGKE